MLSQSDEYYSVGRIVDFCIYLFYFGLHFAFGHFDDSSFYVLIHWIR